MGCCPSCARTCVSRCRRTPVSGSPPSPRWTPGCRAGSAGPDTTTGAASSRPSIACQRSLSTCGRPTTPSTGSSPSMFWTSSTGRSPRSPGSPPPTSHGWVCPRRCNREIGLASCVRVAYKLNHMVQYSAGRLDASFAALSDATRRGVLERLGRGDASISDLAETFDMTLTGMRKHVGVLEHAELVTTEKVGRVRTCRLGPRRLEDETAWIEQQRRLWDARFDVLEQVVAERRRKERNNGHPKRS